MRHIERKHIGEEEEAVIIEESSDIIDQREKEVKEDDDINDFLNNIGLEQYANIFKENDIDIHVLFDLRINEFMEMSKELGISSCAHRHKIKRAMEEKSKAVLVVRDRVDGDLIEETPNDKGEYVEKMMKPKLKIWWSIWKLNNVNFARAQHSIIGRLCRKQVCNLFCSIQAPSSENESHIIHRYGAKRCRTDEVFPCSECPSRYDTQ